MPDDNDLFAFTQWILRAALICNMALIVITIGATAAVAVRVDTMLVSPAQFEQFVHDKSGELARNAANALNANFDLGIAPEKLTDAAHKLAERINRDDIADIAMTLLAGGAGVLIVLQLILRAILRIVTRASEGDPFVADNADDLGRVAWLLLGIYGVEYVTAFAAHAFVPASLKEFPLLNTGHPDFPATGVFTALLIFVLAQIFRRGAAMREELEGTV